MTKLLATLAALCLTAALHAQPATSSQAERAGQGPALTMQQFIANAVDQAHFTGSVLVVKDGSILVDQGYGSADLEWKIPNSPATRFRLGSLTKQFTAASILLLEERGKLSLNDLVCKYMPACPAAWSQITLYQVLTHTAGIPNFTEFPDYTATQWKPTTPAELVARFSSKPLDFPPGSKFSYSNSGYVLLGYLLETITGQTYADFLQQNIFTPLGMADTGVDSTRIILPNRAQGYHYTARGFVHAGYISMTVPFSAGDLYSTTGDLLKWELALIGNKLLKPASFKKMTTPHLQQYGLGVGIVDLDGHRLLSHDGGVNGFATHLSELPEDHLTVIVLANSEDANVGALGLNLIKLGLGQTVPLPAPKTAHVEVPVDPAALPGLPGTYRFAPTFAIVVTLEDGKLMAQATGQSKFQVFPESPTRFFLKVVDAQIEFTLGPDGKATALTLYQNGIAQKAPRE